MRARTSMLAWHGSQFRHPGQASGSSHVTERGVANPHFHGKVGLGRVYDGYMYKEI